MRWFRKHQKKLMVFFGVILMALFVLGSAMPWLGTGSGPNFNTGTAVEEAKKTVVSWNGGKLTRGEMSRMAALHFATIRFQDQLMQLAAKNNPNWPGPQAERIQLIPGDPQSEEFQRALFGRFLLAEYGKERLDLAISPNVIDEYIYTISDGLTLSDQDWFNLNEAANRGAFDYRDIQDYMKTELAAMRVDDLLSGSLPFQGMKADPRRPQPASFGNVLDQFLAYLQSERRFECSVLPFKVADYISQVSGEPSFAEIRQLYEEGRYLEPGERFESPGFKRPRKLSVEFLRADQQAFVDVAIQSVTKEEVLAEYNRLVAAKDPLVMEIVPPAAPATNPPPGAEKLEDAPPANPGAMPAEAKPADAEQPAGEKPADDAAGAKPAETPDSDPAPTPEKGDGNQPAPAASEKSGEAPPGDGQAGGGGPRAFIQEPGGDPAPAPADPAPADPAPADPAPADANKNPPAEAPQEPANVTPAENQPAPQNPAGDAAAAPTTPNPTAAAQEPTVPEQEQRAKPLDDALELRIKQRLKADDARKAFEAALEAALYEMSDFQVDLADYEASLNDPEGEKVERPASLDMQALADKYHMTSGVITAADYETLRGSELGQAIEFDRLGGRIVSGADILFANFDKLTPYYPTKIGGNFLYWVTEKKPATVPSLEEVRPEIVQYWKEQKAYELAKGAAEAALGQVRGANQTLLQKFPEQAKQTGEFSWFGSTPPLAVEMPGPEFLSGAYQLPLDDLIVVPNADRSVIYLVQKTKEDPRSIDELRDAFFKNIATFKQPYVTTVPRFYAQQAVREWVDIVNDQLGVRWEGY